MVQHNPLAPGAGRLSELDALRGIAALLVLVQHARVMGLDPRPFDSPLLEKVAHMLMHFSPLRVLEYGRGAVMFFFVLSGYVLTRALVRNGSPGLLAFAAQRSVRLLLPVAASVLLSAGLFAVLLGDAALLPAELRGRTIDTWHVAPGLLDILRESALLRTASDPVQLNPVLWSLVHEWRLTLLLPLALLFRGRVGALLALGCIGMALGAMVTGAENRVQLGLHFRTTLMASVYFGLAIASGAGLALWGPLPQLTRDRRLVGAAACLSLFSMASDIAVYAASILLIVLAQQPGAFRRFLRRAPLVRLGHVSYSLYLVHVPVLVASMVLLHGTLPVPACLIAGIVAALAAAEVFHRLAEVPARDLARCVERRLRPPRSEASVPAGRGVKPQPLPAAEGGSFR
jgi:peptidoglycan/LPS O-acetylase OafA/YrhL